MDSDDEPLVRFRSTASSSAEPTKKKARLRENAEDDEPAENPPDFKEHKLREDQLKSLSWMMKQEKVSDVGLLADAVGYGKTATTIGLISMDDYVGKIDRCPAKDGFVQLDATLIVAPTHLVSQWKDEFVKFLGLDFISTWKPSKLKSSKDNRDKLIKLRKENIDKLDEFELEFKSKWSSRRSLSWSTSDQLLRSYKKDRKKLINLGKENCNKLVDDVTLVKTEGSGDFKILILDSLALFVQMSQQDIWKGKFKVVIVALNVLHSSDYKQAMEMYNPTHPGSRTTTALKEFQLCLKKDIKDHGLEGFMQERRLAPILQMYWWRRVVFDEFHEKVSDDHEFRINTLRQSIGTTNRWCISGTPPLSASSKAAKLLVNNCCETSLQLFLNEHALQNKSEIVEGIPICEHVQKITITSEELLLYCQVDHDTHRGGSSPLEARTALIRRCAHFDLAGSQNAGDAVRHMGKEKRQHVLDTEEKFRIEASRAAFLSLLEELDLTFSEKCSAFINDKVIATPVKDFKKDCKEGKNSEEHTVVHAVVRRLKMKDAKFRKSRFCKPACCDGSLLLPTLKTLVSGAAKLMDDAHRSLTFYENQLRNIHSTTCTVCLEDMNEIQNVSILPCTHSFHTDCIYLCLEARRACPTCRNATELKDISLMAAEIAEPVEISRDCGAYGSKLDAISLCLKNIRDQDPTAKAIVFTQWTDLGAKVASSLKAANHDFMSLNFQSGIQNGRLLAEFEKASEPWILLMSMDKAASGANLTSVNHVLFVHPMVAETKEMAADYEKQAIGRVRRVGQKRDVHVWKFVTCGTIEEEWLVSSRAARRV